MNYLFEKYQTMRDFEKNSKRKQRGGALIGALVFTVVISMLLAGIGTL